MIVPIKEVFEIERQLYSNYLNFFIERTFRIVNQGTNFVDNWHIDAIAEALNEVYNGNIKRLIINMPPRYLKSFCVSVAFPAWVLGNDPTKRVIVASYSEKLSIKHSTDTRLIMQSKFFKRIFPQCKLNKNQNEKYKFATTQNGFRFATSVGGTLTGEGGDILIVDDPHNPQQVLSGTYREKTLDWFSNTFISRLNDKKKGAIIVVMQRLHENDLTNFLLEKGGWTHLNLQAINEEERDIKIGDFEKHLEKGELLFEKRENLNDLNNLKNTMSIYNFNAQYQQKPLLMKNGMLSKNWLKKYNNNVEFDNVYLSFDTAIKAGIYNDPTVCTVWGEKSGSYYLIEVIRKWLEYPELKKEAINLINKYKPNCILIEDKASGQSLIQDLKRETQETIIPIKVLKDKITRFASITPLFESGKVFIKDNTDWLFDYEYELLSFPVAVHDDQVDSTSQFLNWIKNKSNKTFNARVKRI